ncbi:MAG: YkvA family protein [Bacteroidota bacterium]
MARKTPPLFERFKKHAAELVKNPGKVLDELVRADEKAEQQGNKITKFKEDLKVLVRLVRSWAKGEYKDVPAFSIILAIAAIVYFVSPVDAIPDWIPVLGYLDDAAVVGFVIYSIKSDLDEFHEWEKKKS